jgi:hypothetical protein
MTTSFKAVLALSTAALLAACGGGGGNIDTTTPPVNQPAWASPAMFVPAGQAQINVAVSDCRDNSRIRASSTALPAVASVPTGTLVNSPSLVITSAGDVIFSGAISPATAVTELARVNFASSTDREIEFNSDATRNTFDVGNTTTNLYTGRSDGSATFSAYANNGSLNVTCTTVANLTPAYAPSEARLAAKFTAGVTAWQEARVRGTSTIPASSIVVWDNQAQNTRLEPNQTSVKFASLNLATGALNVGPSSSQVTQSVLLSTALATSGLYREADYEDGDFNSGRSKSVRLEVETTTQGRLKFDSYSGDNIIYFTPQLGTLNIMPPALPVMP